MKEAPSPHTPLPQELSTEKAPSPRGVGARGFSVETHSRLTEFAFFHGVRMGKVLIKLFQKFAQVEGAKPSSRSAEREMILGVSF